MNYDNFPTMKIALAQISSHLGNVPKNFERHLEIIEKAKKEQVDLVVFPELSLTGYTLKDLAEEVALNPEKSSLFKKLTRESREVSLALGFVEERGRGLFYNSAAYLSGGKILHIHRKIFLPTYGMFEEAKFFAQGKNVRTFSTPYGKKGMMICYDFLHYGASYLLFAGGADMIIVLSAAPGRGISNEDAFTSSRMWELMGEAISLFSTSFVIYCNRTGFEDGKSFAGGSFLFSPAGRLMAKASYTEEEFLLAEVDLEEITRVRRKRPYMRDEKPEIILEALKRIVRADED